MVKDWKISQLRKEVGKLGGNPTLKKEIKVLDNQTDNQKPTPSSSSSSSTSNNKEKKGSDFVLPDWVPKESWDGFVEARRKKKGLTDRAKTLIVNKLYDLKSKGYSPSALLDEAVEKGWMTVYEPKQQGGNGNYGRYQRGNRIPEQELPREAQEALDRAKSLARGIIKTTSGN